MNQSTSQNRHRQLRAFCQAAKTGSISKAASRLKLSQPSISLQIQALEKELNILLFERRGPRIRLTPAGQLLQDMAEPLVEGMDNLVDTFSSAVSDVTTGPLDIASGESTLLYILPELTKHFMDTYPNITVRLHNVTGRDGTAMMRDDSVDFAIGAMDEVPKDLTYYPIYNYNPVLIAPVDHPLADRTSVTAEDISPHGLILPPRSLSTLNQIDAVFQDHGLPCHVVLEVGGWEVIKRYVELGLGISIVTSFCNKYCHQLLPAGSRETGENSSRQYLPRSQLRCRDAAWEISVSTGQGVSGIYGCRLLHNGLWFCNRY